MNNSQVNASVTVINASRQPVDVVGIDSPTLGPDMTGESITVPPGERVVADMTLSPDCDAPAIAGHGRRLQCRTAALPGRDHR